MEEIGMNILEIEGHKYFLVDSLSDGKENYHFFANVEDSEDIYVFKDNKENEEEFFVSVDNEQELDYAFGLFYDKYKDKDFS